MTIQNWKLIIESFDAIIIIIIIIIINPPQKKHNNNNKQTNQETKNNFVQIHSFFFAADQDCTLFNIYFLLFNFLEVYFLNRKEIQLLMKKYNT